MGWKIAKEVIEKDQSSVEICCEVQQYLCVVGSISVWIRA